MMGGTMRSPLTSIAFVIELTHDLNTLPALLVGCVTAHAVTVLLMKRSILTEKVARRGYHVIREYSVSPLARFRVEDVMERDIPTIPADMHVDDMLRRLLTHDPVLGRRNAWPLVDDGGALVGILTRGDLLAAIDREGDHEPTVLDIGSRELVVAYADDLLEDALDTMIRAERARLPVINRDQPTRLVGMISRDGLAAAYRAVREEEYLRERGGAGLTVPRSRARQRSSVPLAEASSTATLVGNGTGRPTTSSERVEC